MSCNKNFCKLLWLKAPTCKAAYMMRNYYVIQHTFNMSVLFEESELSLQGKVMLFHVQDNVRWRRRWRQHFCETSILACDVTSRKTVIFMVTAVTVTKSHIDHCHLTFIVYLSLPVNLPIVTLWALQSRWSINKAKCRIWEIINSNINFFFFISIHSLLTAVLHTVIQ